MKEQMKMKYVDIHKQGWMPIFVNDALDASQLAEACVTSGCKAIEVTCRRPNAVEEIRAIRRAYPDLIILAGSVVEDSVLLAYLQNKRPGFPSMQRLEDAGVDGFVAQFPFSEDTIRAYAHRSILIPGVETLAEAVSALRAGAHFCKFCSSSPTRIQQLNSEATHRLLPIFYTGGASLTLIPEYVRAGAAMIGGGWDLMLADLDLEDRVPYHADLLVERLLRFKQTVHEARMEHHAGFAERWSADPDTYLRGLTHYHPF